VAAGLVLALIGVFLIVRTVTKDGTGQNLAGRILNL